MDNKRFDISHETTFSSHCEACGHSFSDKSLGLTAKIAQTHSELCKAEGTDAQHEALIGRHYLGKRDIASVKKCLKRLRKIVVASGRSEQEIELTHCKETIIIGGSVLEYLTYRVVLPKTREVQNEG